VGAIQDLHKRLAEFEASPDSRGLDLRLSLADLIIRKLRAKRWTQKRLADEVGMLEPFITRVIHARQNCTFDVAGRILFALGISAEITETIPEPAATEAGYKEMGNGETWDRFLAKIGGEDATVDNYFATTAQSESSRSADAVG
jgi:hypothetical protein